MKRVSTLAVAISLALGGASFAAPALAQTASAQTPAETPARKYNFSKEALKPMQALQAAFNSGDAAAFATALAAAQAAAKNSDDRLVIAQFRINQALKVNDNAQLLSALEAALASGGASPREQVAYYSKIGELHYNNKNFEGAATAFAKLGELEPNNFDAVMNLAAVRGQQKNSVEAARLIDRAISLKKATGQPVPEAWYKSGLKHTYDAKLAAESAKLSRELISAYPTQTNWRDALLIYRQTARVDSPTSLDTLRLMRATKSLVSEAEYYELANGLHEQGYPGEAKAILEEGIAARAISATSPTFKALLASSSQKVVEDRASLAASESKAMSSATGNAALQTGDVYYGYGNYAKAASLYRTALQKGSVDANLVNTRLGMALAHAGQRAEAEAAFKAVTGPRAELASFWLLWLSKRA